MHVIVPRSKEKDDVVQLMVTSTDGFPYRRRQKAEGFVGSSVAARRLHFEKITFHEKHPQLGCFFIFTNAK